jgi:Icc protein
LQKNIIRDRKKDGIEGRGFLGCMDWAGSGVVWSLGSGLASSRAFGQQTTANDAAGFGFVQISDGHMGFETCGA